MRRFSWLIVAFWPLAAMGQAPAPNSEPAPAPAPDTMARIETEEQLARERFVEKARGVATAEEGGVYKAFRAQMLSLMDRALTLARLHPGEHEAIDASAWVAAGMTPWTDDEIGERRDAAYRLLANAPILDDPVIHLAINAVELIGLHCPEVDPFLRSVLSRSRNPDLVTRARFELGSHLAEMARIHDRLAAPISGPELLEKLPKVCVDRCRAYDPAKLRSEAEALLEQVVREQGVQPLTLGGLAMGDLYRIRHLRIGQPAPELVGEDVDGAPIRLSDFRGKVVVLSFWETSSNPCMMLIDGEKDLVEAMKGRPFALVGVNGDAAENRGKVQKAVAREGITWRSFWAGGRDGAIPREWGVQRWPTVYTIDAKGIILDDQIGEKLTPAAFEPLVQAVEEAAR